MQKAIGNAFCPQFSPRLAEMRLLLAGYSTRIPARGLFSQSYAGGLFMKRYFGGKRNDSQTSYRVAAIKHGSEFLVYLLVSFELNPSQYIISFDLFIFFFKYCQLNEKPVRRQFVSTLSYYISLQFIVQFFISKSDTRVK